MYQVQVQVLREKWRNNELWIISPELRKYKILSWSTVASLLHILSINQHKFTTRVDLRCRNATQRNAPHLAWTNLSYSKVDVRSGRNGFEVWRKHTNWSRCFKDAGRQTQRPRFLGHHICSHCMFTQTEIREETYNVRWIWTGCVHQQFTRYFSSSDHDLLILTNRRTSSYERETSSTSAETVSLRQRTCLFRYGLRQDECHAGDDVERDQRTSSAPSVSHTRSRLLFSVKLILKFYASQTRRGDGRIRYDIVNGPSPVSVFSVLLCLWSPYVIGQTTYIFMLSFVYGRPM